MLGFPATIQSHRKTIIFVLSSIASQNSFTALGRCIPNASAANQISHRGRKITRLDLHSKLGLSAEANGLECGEASQNSIVKIAAEFRCRDRDHSGII